MFALFEVGEDGAQAPPADRQRAEGAS